MHFVTVLVKNKQALQEIVQFKLKMIVEVSIEKRFNVSSYRQLDVILFFWSILQFSHKV